MSRTVRRKNAVPEVYELCDYVRFEGLNCWTRVKLEGSALVLAINKFHSDSYVSSGMVPSTFKKKYIHIHSE